MLILGTMMNYTARGVGADWLIRKTKGINIRKVIGHIMLYPGRNLNIVRMVVNGTLNWIIHTLFITVIIAILEWIHRMFSMETEREI